MKPYARWLLRLIGPAILAYFLLTTDLSRIALNLTRVHWPPVLVSLALYPLLTVVKAWRWARLMRSLGMTPPPLMQTMRLYMVGLFFGGATPGQAGDFAKAWYLRERGESLGRALFSILLDRLFDVMIMALAALVGLVLLLPFLPPERRGLVEVAVIAATLAMVLIIPALMARRAREWLMLVAARRAPAGLGSSLDRWRSQLTALELRPVATGAVLGATIGAAALSIGRVWLLFSALAISIPALALIAAVALISILQTLPISFSGVGVRDAVLVAVLGAYGYRADEALALSALFLLLNLENIAVGFVASLRAGGSAADARLRPPRAGSSGAPR
jgi:uncharacterized protein (TIRG00374 family)